MTCESCQALTINGLYCHEFGCPDRWKGTIRECAWCGQEFSPETRYQTTCDSVCRADYFGIEGGD